MDYTVRIKTIQERLRDAETCLDSANNGATDTQTLNAVGYLAAALRSLSNVVLRLADDLQKAKEGEL